MTVSATDPGPDAAGSPRPRRGVRWVWRRWATVRPSPSRNRAFDRGLAPDPPGRRPGGLGRQPDLGGTGKTPMVEWVARWYRRRPRPGGHPEPRLSAGAGPQRRRPGAGGEPARRPPPPGPRSRPVGADRRRGARVGAAGARRRLPASSAGARPRHRADRCPRPVRPGAAASPRLAPRAGRRRCGGPAWWSCRGPTWSTAADRAAIRREAERRAGPLRWVEARHAPLDLIDADGTRPSRSLTWRAVAVAAFCGIGNPEGFRRTLRPLCGVAAGFRIFPDHHAYGAADVAA